jgi:hypothetical protein
MNWHKDFVRRAAKFRVDTYPSFVVSLGRCPPPAFPTSYAKYLSLYFFTSIKKGNPYGTSTVYYMYGGVSLFYIAHGRRY